MAYMCRKGPSKEMVDCPYDSHHSVSIYNLYKHLDKCRRNWRLACQRSGEKRNVFVCQHNPDHFVLAPELKWHERRCEDRNKTRSYQVNIEALREAGYLSTWSMALPQQPVWNPRRKRRFQLGVIYGSQNFGKGIRMDEVNDPELRKTREEEEARQAAEEAQRKEDEFRRMKESMTKEEWEEYLEWNQNVDDTIPAFDYMQVATNPKPEWGRYPLNLTRQERKQYEKVMAKRYYPTPI